MARVVGRLTALSTTRLKYKGMYPDGGGLYLQVTEAGAKSWVYRFRLAGRSREMGLGPFSIIDLKSAREKASECRRLRHDGIDPIEARLAMRQQAAVSAAGRITFDQAATAYISSHKVGWKSAKHAEQWTNTLKTYASPVIGELPVQAVETGHVMRVLEPIWTAKTETASRVRNRMEAVLDWATARGFRRGENPARWRAHLEKLLPARTKVRKVVHHAALAYSDLPTFMTELTKQPGASSSALKFLILTGTRTAETIGARWEEFNLDGGIWVIPPSRMKAGREHRVPLSPAVVKHLRDQSRIQDNPYVFAGGKTARPLSNMALLALLKRMERADLTVHGFRSTFRDWAAEQTNFPREVAEMALAHTIGDKVEAAYRRGDLFEKRRQLMGVWSDYCLSQEAT